MARSVVSLVPGLNLFVLFGVVNLPSLARSVLTSGRSRPPRQLRASVASDSESIKPSDADVPSPRSPQALEMALLQEEDGSAEGDEDGVSQGDVELQDHRGLKKGARVRIHDLQMAVELNGQQATVRSFDSASGRYIVWIPEKKKVMKVRAKNLQLLAASKRSAGHKHKAEKGDNLEKDWELLADGQRATKGTEVRIHGLAHAKELNGRRGTVRTFDFSTKRYVVELKGESPRKIKPGNLDLVGEHNVPESSGHVAAVGSTPKISEAPSTSQSVSTPGHLRYPPEQSQPVMHANASQEESICKVQGQSSEGPLGLKRGARVRLHSLTSSAAQQGHWNGMVGIIHCFDEKSQRYVVELPNGMPRKIKPSHLNVLAGADVADGTSVPPAHATPAAEPKQWKEGLRVQLVGLKKTPSLNGKVGVILKFEDRTQRYIVQLPDGSTKRIKAAHLVAAVEGQPDGKPAAVATEAAPAEQTSQATPRYSVCNAYTAPGTLQVFAIPDGEPADHHKYARVVRDLPYQDCGDVQDIPFNKGSLSFVVGRMEIARIPLNSTDVSSQGLELTVFRSNVNTLKGSVHQNPVKMSDNGAYYLHVVNAYAGSKLLELRVQRGAFTKTLPLDATYRLNRYAPITLMLTDGFRHVTMGFQPQAGKTYCVATTGTDFSFHGEPREVGLLTHELGAWTASEEMPSSKEGSQHQPAPVAAEPAAAEELAPMDAGPEATLANVGATDGEGGEGNSAAASAAADAEAEADAVAAEAEAEADAAGGAQHKPHKRRGWSSFMQRIVSWVR